MGKVTKTYTCTKCGKETSSWLKNLKKFNMCKKCYEELTGVSLADDTEVEKLEPVTGTVTNTTLLDEPVTQNIIVTKRRYKILEDFERDTSTDFTEEILGYIKTAATKSNIDLKLYLDMDIVKALEALSIIPMLIGVDALDNANRLNDILNKLERELQHQWEKSGFAIAEGEKFKQFLTIRRELKRIIFIIKKINIEYQQTVLPIKAPLIKLIQDLNHDLDTYDGADYSEGISNDRKEYTIPKVASFEVSFDYGVRMENTFKRTVYAADERKRP